MQKIVNTKFWERKNAEIFHYSRIPDERPNG